MGVKSKTPIKHSVKFILAEDARSEGDGKFSLLGVFPGERVAIVGDPPPGLLNGTFIMSSLVCVFILGGSDGKYPGHFSIIAPDKKSKVVDVAINQPVQILKDRPAVFVTNLKPFLGPAFGTYFVNLEIGKEKFKFPFVIEKAPPAAKINK
jgi:hypothetical protein